MSKAKKRASVATAFAVLVGKFPQAFAADPECRKPLKIGIDADLTIALDGAIRPRELRLALTLYCGSVGYLRNCEVGAERIDLDGDVTGVVTEAEAEHARVKLAADTKKAATAATPQPPAERLSLADLKRAAQMRKEAAQ